MNWFRKLFPSRILTSSKQKKGVPEGLWQKCPACDAVLYRPDLEQHHYVCNKCDHHLPLTARQRIDLLLDETPRLELARKLEPIDFLKFRDSKRYRDRLMEAKKSTGESDALVIMKGRMNSLPLVLAVFEYRFIGGSMGAVVGEKFVRGAHHALKHHIPLVCVSASGGARMQEGLISLMQMAKTSAALAKLAQAGVPFLSVLTDPTMGGVSASFAMLGDLIVAEPKALIGFAGPRVIEQTVRRTLPEGFQRSEFLLAHGAIDQIIHRAELKNTLARMLKKLQSEPI